MIDLDELDKFSKDTLLDYAFTNETVSALIAEIRKLRSEVDRVWAIHNEFLNGAYFQRGEELHKLREANGVMKNTMNMKGVHSIECQTGRDQPECYPCESLALAAQIMGVEK